MKIRSYCVVIVAAAALAACGHNSAPPVSPQSSLTAPNALRPAGAQNATITHTGNFYEYSLPAGIDPTSVVNGSGTVWFPPCTGSFTTPPTVYRMSVTTGAVSSYTGSSPYFAWTSYWDVPQCPIAAIGGYFWYVVYDSTTENDMFFARVTPGGSFSYIDAGTADGALFNSVVGSDGKIWSPVCLESCGYGGYLQSVSSNGGGLGNNAQFGPNYAATWVTTASDSNLYASAAYVGPGDPTANDKVFKVSTSGTILNSFNLPPGSDPTSIRSGPGPYLWITQTARNKIMRMTMTGYTISFPLPTANAGARRLTLGQDGAMWFTETNGNKIGRISTSGAIAEYKIPTANSGPTGIIPCPTSVCGVKGGVWFAETAANKIARYDFP